MLTHLSGKNLLNIVQIALPPGALAFGYKTHPVCHGKHREHVGGIYTHHPRGDRPLEKPNHFRGMGEREADPLGILCMPVKVDLGD